MKKRMMAVLLCAVMIVPMLILSSCGGGSSSTYTQVTPATITLYSITDEKTTEEGIESAQKAINEYTEVNFGTRVILKLYTEEEYADIVAERLEQMAADNGGVPVVTTSESVDSEQGEDTSEETAEKEETKVYKKRDDVVYPEAGENQVDLFLVNDIDSFNTFCQDGMIAPLNDYLLSSYAILNKFIHPILMQAGQYSTTGIQYAIPNNRIVSDYEYLLLNKELVDKLGYDPDEIHTILQLKEFADDVSANVAGYTPVLDTYGVSTLSVSVDGAGAFFGNYVGYGATGETNAMPKSMFTVGKFKNEYATLRSMRKSGKMIEGEALTSAEANDRKIAAMFMKGDITVQSAYADYYYVIPYKYPTATNKNVYNSMYAISAYTKNANRCMEVLSALMTDSKLRDIFQYGKLNENYEINKDGLVQVLNDEYVMNPIYTGNQFILTPNTDMSEGELRLAENSWSLGKEQNKYLVKSPYCGYSALTTYVQFDGEDTMTTSSKSPTEMLKELKDLCDSYQERIDAYNGAEGEAFVEFLSALGEEMTKEKCFKNATKTIFTNSALSIYNAWYKAMYKTTEEAPG
ncbi:MAG: hypothetical protein PUB34_00300 [Clostridia bacterium]|nr:hypothetical protein [Clostridia bacterium]